MSRLAHDATLDIDQQRASAIAEAAAEAAYEIAVAAGRDAEEHDEAFTDLVRSAVLKAVDGGQVPMRDVRFPNLIGAQ